MIWLLAFLAVAEESVESLPDLWTQLHEGEIAHLIDGKPQEAIEIYEALFKGLTPDHPLFGRILFALGRAYYDIGEHKKSKEILLKAIRSVDPPNDAHEYYIDMLASEHPIKTLPYSGNAWFSLSDSSSFPSRYRVHLLDKAQRFNQANITLEILTEGKVYIHLEDIQGDIVIGVAYFKKGIHNLLIQNSIFPRGFTGEKDIEAITLKTEKEGILSVSHISIR